MSIAIVTLLLLVGIGLPIYLALGMTGVGLFLAEGDSLAGFAQVIVDHLNSGALMAVPFFVMAATFMHRGGIARILVDAANACIGGIQGGIPLAALVATTIFAAISGSSLATALAMGTLLVPEMLRRHYSRRFAVGVIGGAGTLGILIPPSLALIVYGVVAEESVPELFLAGVVPGLLQAALFAVWIIFVTRNDVTDVAGSDSGTRKSVALLKALPALSIPVLAMGGIYGGLVTVTEAAALAATLSILISILVYRNLTPGQILPILAESIRNCAGLILIVAFALAFAHWITASRLPVAVLERVAGMELEGWQFLLLMNGVMLLLGMILEVISVILITVPIVLPLLANFDISPIHYAIILVVNMELALLTPPVGLNLFVLSGISKASMAEVMRGVAPFIALLAILLLAVTFFPALSLSLPGLF